MFISPKYLQQLKLNTHSGSNNNTAHQYKVRTCNIQYGYKLKKGLQNEIHNFFEIKFSNIYKTG